jgi:hypothetical protein
MLTESFYPVQAAEKEFHPACKTILLAIGAAFSFERT